MLGAIALANKMARVVCAILVKGIDYQNLMMTVVA